MSIEIDYLMGTASFHVNIEAAASRATYKGMFKVKCILSPLQYIESDSLYRKLLGKDNPQFANEYVSNLCYALSQLKYRIIEAPEWFKGAESELYGSSIDDNILLHILDLAVKAEDDYRQGTEEKYKEAKENVRKAIDEKELTDGEEELNDIDDEEEVEAPQPENKLGE